MPSFWHILSRFRALPLIALSALAGLAGTGACGSTSSDNTTPATAGTAGSGAAAGSGGSAGNSASACPSMAPAPDSACSQAGLRCGYGDAHVNYLCTAELTWSERTYLPAGEASGGAPGSGGEGGSAGTLVQPEAILCESLSANDCTGQCGFGCCGGGGEGEGCAGCCQTQPCGMIPAELCPAGVCRLVEDCSGKPACAPLLSGPIPECGLVGYYGQDVACCGGVSLRCGAETAEGSCEPTAGGYSVGIASLPFCLECGDRTCEAPYENRCNCAKDCQ